MNAWIIILIVSVVLCGFSLLLAWLANIEWPMMVAAITGIAILVLGFLCILMPIQVKKEMIRQEKERTQILYQIENMNNESDRVKLNEWILTYNDWVNDVNTSKEMFGWFSWYRSVDMSKHTIIELV
jgi:hypothetical protein